MLYVWVGFVFLIGAAVGSFLNVCVARLPFEKSILWPGSRCGRCLQPIRARDNLPLLGYWLLRGRCRSCGQTFSISYFFVELFTACAFAGLFYLEIIRNVLDLPFLRQRAAEIEWGLLPWQAWAVFGFHAVLLGFLITVSLCDVQYMEVPLSVTVCGTIVGLIGATLFPWPFPAGAGPILPRVRMALLAPTPPVPGSVPVAGLAAGAVAVVAAARQLAARPGDGAGRDAGRHGDVARRAFPVRPGTRQGRPRNRRRRRDDDGRQLPRLAADAGVVLRRRLRRLVRRNRPAVAQRRPGSGVRPRPGRGRDDDAADVADH